jgi:hypothetical protein
MVSLSGGTVLAVAVAVLFIRCQFTSVWLQRLPSFNSEMAEPPVASGILAFSKGNFAIVPAKMLDTG